MRSATVGKYGVVTKSEDSRDERCFPEEELQFVPRNEVVRKPIVSRQDWTGYRPQQSQEQSISNSSAKSDPAPKVVGLHNFMSVLQRDSLQSDDTFGRAQSNNSSQRRMLSPPSQSLKGSGVRIARESVDSISNGIPNMLEKRSKDKQLEILDNFQPIYSELSPEPVFKEKRMFVKNLANQENKILPKSTSVSPAEQKAIVRGLLLSEEDLNKLYEPPNSQIERTKLKDVSTVDSVDSVGSAASSARGTGDGAIFHQSSPGTTRSVDEIFGEENASKKAVDDLMEKNTKLTAEKRAKEIENEQLRKKVDKLEKKEKKMEGELRANQENLENLKVRFYYLCLFLAPSCD